MPRFDMGWYEIQQAQEVARIKAKARAALAERALQAMVTDAARQRDSDERGDLLDIADGIAAELAALEAQHD